MKLKLYSLLKYVILIFNWSCAIMIYIILLPFAILIIPFFFLIQFIDHIKDMCDDNIYKARFIDGVRCFTPRTFIHFLKDFWDEL